MKKSSILILLLVAAGLVLNFAFSGHDFLAYTLYLIAFLILLFRLVGKTARRLISLLLILGIGYFVFRRTAQAGGRLPAPYRFQCA